MEAAPRWKIFVTNPIAIIGKYQLNQERVKRQKCSKGHLVVRHFHATQAKQYNHGQTNQRGKGGEEKAPRPDELDIAFHVMAIRLIEQCDFRLFLRVSADHAHTRQVLLRAG